MADLYEELEFPQRAEHLGDYGAYDVDLDHWRELSGTFRKTFREVYARRSAAVLLVYGQQGTGKTMFSTRLAKDYERTVQDAAYKPDLKENLWHVLVGTDTPSAPEIETATQDARLQKIDERQEGWLSALLASAKADTRTRVRIFVFDDAQKDGVVRPWTGLSSSDYFQAQQGGAQALRTTMAQRINDACRDDLRRSILVMLSNDLDWLQGLKTELDRWYKELTTLVELPLPEPPMLEKIVRINTNRLNRVSYWYCLDAAKPPWRQEVYRVLSERRGFTDSFRAVSGSLSAEQRRAGRPANRNLITLVTLGSDVAATAQFLSDREIPRAPHHQDGLRHISVWYMDSHWASELTRTPDRAFLRRARMLESEFVLRWVNLDMLATYALLQEPAPGDLGGKLMDLILHRPSTGDGAAALSQQQGASATLETDLDAAGFPQDALKALRDEFNRLGQQRSRLYEPAITKRAPRGYSRGFAVFGTLRPDLIPDEDSEYRVCALTSAEGEDAGLLADAIRRSGHAIEFTAFLRENLEGLEDYLVDKVNRYAAMLESV